jgi:hypothetical protein
MEDAAEEWDEMKKWNPADRSKGISTSMRGVIA